MGKEGKGEDKSIEVGEPPHVGASWAGKDFGCDFVQDGGGGVRSVQELPVGVARSAI